MNQEEEHPVCEQCMENDAQVVEVMKGLLTGELYNQYLCIPCRNKEIKTMYDGIKVYREYNNIVEVKTFKSSYRNLIDLVINKIG